MTLSALDLRPDLADWQLEAMAYPDAPAIAMRASLREYVYGTYPGVYDMAPYHALIIEHLEALERGDITRLMVFTPPQRGKSELVSVRFPAWLHGLHPDWKYMGFSHTASLADDFSRQVRDQLTDETWPFPDVRLKSGQTTVREWGIAGHGGKHFVAGVLGGGTGKGAMVAVIDDPFKDDVEASSPVFRDRVYQWYGKVVLTRMAPGGRIVLVHTRWHDDDLAGRLLASMAAGGDQWTVLSLPEIAEDGEPDALGRLPGEALWPARYPVESTRTIRLTMPHVWWPLFQQRPSAVGGGMLKREWFARRFDASVLPAYDMVVIVCDSAFKKDMGNDPSAWSIWGATETAIDCIDAWEGRVAYPELIRGLKDFYATWERLDPWLYIEDAASGQSAIQSLQAESMIPVRGFTPKGSKESRAQDASRFAAAGRVRIADGAPWAGPMIDQLVRFPAAAHDEFVDMFSMAVKILTRAVAVSGDPVDDDAEVVDVADDDTGLIA